MNNNGKFIWIALALAGAGFGIYLLIKNRGTKSNDPQKNDRNVTIQRT